MEWIIGYAGGGIAGFAIGLVFGMWWGYRAAREAAREDTTWALGGNYAPPRVVQHDEPGHPYWDGRAWTPCASGAA